MQDIIHNAIAESIQLKQKLLTPDWLTRIEKTGAILAETLRAERKILLCGNGGSAADAQHIACELVGRFGPVTRAGLPAIALTTDTSAMTAIANDFGFEMVFARQVSALLREGDVLIGISTSGNSPNVLQAVAEARQKGGITLGLSGGNDGKLADHADHCLVVPHHETPRIQEAHITIGHIWCDIVERTLFPE